MKTLCFRKKMNRRSLRSLPRISYSEMEDPNLDEYVFCEKCADFVYDYCSIHGPLLVIPDDKVPAKTGMPDFVPRAALTIPRVFLHIARSIIPGAGLGIFSTLTLPCGVRFGPYQGQLTKDIESAYCWQIRDSNNKRSHVIDASDANASNWMRYVNCARHWHEQNLVAYQYQGQIYYRTIKIIPRFSELLVFYGGSFAASLRVDVRGYNSPKSYTQKFGGAPAHKEHKCDQSDVKVSSTPKENGGDDTKSTTSDVKTKINDEEKMGHSNKEKIRSNLKDKFGNTKNDQNNNKIFDLSKSDPCLKVNLSATQNKPKDLICDRCGLFFKCKDTLEYHANNCFKIDECLYNTSIDKLSNTKNKTYFKLGETISNISNIPLFSCEQCKKQFSQKVSLTAHIRVHTKERPYSCSYCEKNFTVKSHLIRHIRIHTKERPYSCSYCEKNFTVKSHLIRHIRIHTKERPYSCSYCEKNFTVKSHLITHIRIHTKERPYSCSYCEKNFTVKSNLITHIRIHTKERPYSCSYCEKNFTVKSHLITHIRIHTKERPYSCSYCEKNFTVKSNLIRHIRIHTKERPYSCSYCEKKFSHKVSLKSHIRVHTIERPHSCS